MNKVDIYVNDVRLDIFQDEEISINLSVQNVQDISKVFTDFTQAFTVPASATNNGVFSYYYRNDVVGGFDGRLRASARIEINSLPFRTGVVELENVQLKGTDPYAYTLTFYGDVVTLTDLFGEDYLYDLDFSDYDHRYDDEEIYDRLTTSTYAPLFYPLMSPVKNWFYQSGSGAGANNEDNIAYKTTGGEGQGFRGIHYYEFKPALKVTAILDAMEAKYGISFTGAFLSALPFSDLSLWLHRKEGYMYQDQPNAVAYQKINFQTRTGTYFDLANDTFDTTSLGVYSFTFFVNTLSVEANVGLFINGAYRSSIVVPTSAIGTTITSQFFLAAAGDRISLRIKPTQNSTPLTYRFTTWAMDLFPSTSLGTASMSATDTITGTVRVSELMPEIKVKDFLAGIIKMYNMVIVPTAPNTFLLQPLQDWYAAGTDKDFQEYLDITQYVVNRPPLYREIEFKYQPTEQILGFQYQQTNNVGFGDLNTNFDFDGDELLIDVPFECPLYERLTDLHTDALTNVIVYKSITSETNEAGIFNPYLGAPILFYATYRIKIDSNPVGYVNVDGTHRRVDDVWYANTSNRYDGIGAAYSICFGGDIDPFFLQSINRSLYYTEWSDYITDLYSAQRRVYNVEAVLPIGKIITLNLQNAIVWNNTKYIINNVSLNMTTGKTTFELLNVV
jgi:hypothetical protein